MAGKKDEGYGIDPLPSKDIWARDNAPDYNRGGKVNYGGLAPDPFGRVYAMKPTGERYVANEFGGIINKANPSLYSSIYGKGDVVVPSSGKIDKPKLESKKTGTMSLVR
jgi:hypothetical protein